MPRNDDPQIGDDVVLWRAVPKRQIQIVHYGSESIESWAFRQFPDNELSAHIAAETTLQLFTAQFPLEEFRIAELTVGDARACRNFVCRDPEGGGASHVLICPTVGKARHQVYKDAKKLARRARLRPEGA